MRYTPNGNAVTSFSVATNRRYTTSDGENREETEWFRAVAWNRLGEQCNQFLVKGRRVYVEGRLHSRSWTGNDGQARFTNEINAERVVFLDGVGGDVTAERTATPSQQSGSSEDPQDAQDLPW